MATMCLGLISLRIPKHMALGPKYTAVNVLCILSKKKKLVNFYLFLHKLYGCHVEWMHSLHVQVTKLFFRHV